MSVVIKREHPSGTVGLSVGAFPDDEQVVLGIGPLKNMRFFTMTGDESVEVSEALANAAKQVP